MSQSIASKSKMDNVDVIWNTTFDEFETKPNDDAKDAQI
jgi:hypothetical protein